MLVYQVKSRTVANKDLDITFFNRWIGTFSGNYMYSNTISPKQRKFQIWLPSILQFSTKMLINQVKSTKVAKISETVFKLQSRNFCLQNSKGHNSNTYFWPKISPPAPKCQLVNIGFLKLEVNTNILIYVNLWRTAGWTHLKKIFFAAALYLQWSKKLKLLKLSQMLYGCPRNLQVWRRFNQKWSRYG